MNAETATTTQHLIDIAKDILIANPSCLLSGSIALSLQGKNTRRQPKDIDIFLPYGVNEVLIPDMKIALTDGDNDEYDDEYYERRSYKYKGQIDFFTPLDEEVRPSLLMIPLKGCQSCSLRT